RPAGHRARAAWLPTKPVAPVRKARAVTTPNCTDCAVPCGLDGGAEPISLVVGACAWAWGGRVSCEVSQRVRLRRPGNPERIQSPQPVLTERRVPDLGQRLGRPTLAARDRAQGRRMRPERHLGRAYVDDLTGDVCSALGRG